jgi:hypothetical protein
MTILASFPGAEDFVRFSPDEARAWSQALGLAADAWENVKVLDSMELHHAAVIRVFGPQGVRE